MTDKAILTWRGGGRSARALAQESAAVDRVGAIRELAAPTGTIISGDDEQFRELESQGYRVKVLPDINILRVGRYQIDIERSMPAPEVPQGLDTAPNWPHHLVQLAGPPHREWITEIESHGVDVVEPLSGYGLFVFGAEHDVTALRALPYVAWTGPFEPAYRISTTADGVPPDHISVGVYPPEAMTEVRVQAEAAGATVIGEGRRPAGYGGEFATLTVAPVTDAVPALAAIPFVRWVEPTPGMAPEGEREVQIVAENLDGVAPPNTGPVTGYQAWLSILGVTGAGVSVAIADTGVDANADNNTAVAHADVRGRQAAFVDYSAGLGITDTDGHGTHVAGIAVGNAASGQVEAAVPGNFLWGQGVAPEATYVNQNFLDDNVAPQPPSGAVIEDAATSGAQVMNNSWGVNNSGGDGYTGTAWQVDIAARDPNPNTPELERLAIVFSAGNAGGRPTSITQPHEAKNAIVVGNSLTARPGSGFSSEDIRGIAGQSSRGPAVDGRTLPTVVAPGTNVPSALSRTADPAYNPPIPGTGVPNPADPAQLVDRYVFRSGTSMACPHVAGACALLAEWWRHRTGGQLPSQAMLKALLVNGAEDLAGGENWRCLNSVDADKTQWTQAFGDVYQRPVAFAPDAVDNANTQLTQVAGAAAISAAGQWAYDAAAGQLYVRNLSSTNPGVFGGGWLNARDAQPLAPVPNDDQGWGRVSLPNMMLQSPASDRGPTIFSDQKHAFTTTGQEFIITVAPVDTNRPMRITLAWTDAAAAFDANPALVNDLDLEVTELGTGNVFKGNVFAGGFSVTGGAFDARNNVECVFVQSPSGTYQVRVIASVVAANANPAVAGPWQDFALVVDNADVPAADPVSVVPVLDRSGSMDFYGYTDLTRTSSKLVVDELSIDDQLGVVGFGSTAQVEFPPGGPLQTITGQPVKDAAAAAIDGMAFTGCTFMGDGIQHAGTLLTGATGARAIVLLSDGYDNKGCAQGNPMLPWALDAAAALPADVPIFSCAMGPVSDQALLRQLATITGGRYYYLPTIDDLFEIYNYIRGQVSGDSLAANRSATAPGYPTAVFVDAAAEAVTFTVAWANPAIHAVLDDPGQDEISIRLRDPAGRLVPAHASYVRRRIEDGYAIFSLVEPAPGQWKIEVHTSGATTVRYTAAGFVRSPLRLLLAHHPVTLSVGTPLDIAAVVLDGQDPSNMHRSSATVSRPELGLAHLIDKFRTKLDQVAVPSLPGGDTLPDDIARLRVLQKKRPNLFGRVTGNVKLMPTQTFPLDQALLSRPEFGLAAGTPVLANSFADTTQPGGYNVTVTVSGISPSSGTRFVRTEMMSVFVSGQIVGS